MTTYDGKCAGFNNGKKMVVNREPLYVNKKIYQKDIETFYRVHRERVVSSEPMVDDNLKTYSFLENQTWKKYREKLEEDKLIANNERIYDHITQVETSEGRLMKEKKAHLEKIQRNSAGIIKFKLLTRKREMDRIQRENRFLHDRLKSIKPYYAVKEFEDFYEGHLQLKKDRKTDHTAGHILSHCPQELLSGSLPPLKDTMSSLDKALQDAHARRSTSTSTIRTSNKSLAQRSLSSEMMLGGGGGGSISNYPSIADTIDFLDVRGPLGQLPKMDYSKSQGGGGNGGGVGEGGGAVDRGGYHSRSNSLSQNNNNKRQQQHGHVIDSSLSYSDSSNMGNGNGENNNNSSNSSNKPKSSANTRKTKRISMLTTSRENSIADENSVVSFEQMENYNESSLEDKLLLLVSRPMPLPLATKNCLVRAYCSCEYDENIYLRVMSSDLEKILCERILTIDDAYEMLSSDLAKVSSGEDLQSLRTLLVNMFKEADDLEKGYLTYEEFQLLMEKVDLGITPQELRFVIAEADENENGFIDYHEFVPLAVDMIQAFKARSRAKHLQAEVEELVDDQVLQTISSEELENMARICMIKFEESDAREIRALRAIDLRKCMKESTAGLTHSEMNLIIQTLPRDPAGRILYDEFKRVLYEVRYTSMKNTMIEAQGSEVQKYLMELCKEEEKLKMAANGEDGTTSGWIPLRSLIDLMMRSPRLSLSRLQVMVIASEATIQDGKVNYWRFVPIAAKTIEMMFDPKALRRRAELIEKSDISAETLLKGITQDSIQRRLMTLFKSYDVDHSGELDPKEFRACLESLDLRLSAGEILTLMAVADQDHSGSISYIEFCEFCSNNLVHLEREKHIRLLQSAVSYEKLSMDNDDKDNDMNNLKNQETEELQQTLLKIFIAADVENSGFLNVDGICVIFESLDVGLSAYQLSVVLSELDTNEDGLIEYKEFVPVCADLILAFKGNKYAMQQKELREEWAATKAQEMSKTFYSEIESTIEYLDSRLKIISENIEDVNGQKNAVVQILRSPHSGLNRTEVNMLMTKLFTKRDITSNNITTATSTSTALMPSETRLGSTNTSRRRSQMSSLNSKNNNDNNIIPSSIVNTNNINTTISLLSEQIPHLVEYVTEVRQTTIMRGLLETLNPSELALQLLKAFEEEAIRLYKEENINNNTDIHDNNNNPDDNNNLSDIIPTTLPYNSCYHILKESNYLRLNNVQLLAIMSWADCFEENSTGIDYKAFARYAADVIVKMGDAKELERRAEVVARVKNMGESKVLGNLTSESLETYLEGCFVEIEDSRGNVDEKGFHAVLQSIPSVNLSDREASSVGAVVARSLDGTIQWREFIPWAFSTVYEVCRERMIGRRMALLKVVTDPDDRSQLERLAQKLVDFIRLKHYGGKIIISFPTDELKERESRRSTAVIMLQPRTHNAYHDGNGRQISPNGGIAGDAFRSSNADGTMRAPDQCELIRLCRLIPAVYKDGHKNEIAVMIRIIEVDTITYPEKTPLLIYVCSIDMKIKASIPLPIRMPSIGLVDREAAEQFALNLVDKIYIKIHPKLAPQLHVSIGDFGEDF
eukprot:gene4128-8205_t